MFPNSRDGKRRDSEAVQADDLIMFIVADTGNRKTAGAGCGRKLQNILDQLTDRFPVRRRIFKLTVNRTVFDDFACKINDRKVYDML